MGMYVYCILYNVSILYIIQTVRWHLIQYTIYICTKKIFFTNKIMNGRFGSDYNNGRWKLVICDHKDVEDEK